MTKPIEKPTRQPLVHHPSDVLDFFCHCDETSQSWLEFDEKLSDQIADFEAKNLRYVRVRSAFTRRSTT
jgi:hypothetical protein